jgi:aspartate 1-decarboxylase
MLTGPVSPLDKCDADSFPHRQASPCHVTEARLDYAGSITSDSRLLQAANIVPFQLVHSNSMATAVHWETYVIPGRAGEIRLNGCPGRDRRAASV